MARRLPSGDSSAEPTRRVYSIWRDNVDRRQTTFLGLPLALQTETSTSSALDREVSSLGVSGTFEAPLSMSEAIFRHIGRAIVEGTLRPNQRLVEMQLCQQFGCSRSPLREAIRMLAAEGLVVLTPRRGARVAELTSKTLRDVFEVRILLESLAARLAADHRSEEDVAHLKAMSASMRQAVETGALNTFFALNTAFHQTIARIGGNTYLAALQETAANRSFLPLFMFLSDLRHLSAAVDAHDDIVRAIERGDAPDAERSMWSHLREIEREAARLVESRAASDLVATEEVRG